MSVRLILPAVALASVIAVQAPRLPAQSAPAAPPVTVDFLAIGRDGVPAVDLAPGQVELKVDGRPRALVSLRYVTAADQRTSPAPVLDPPYATNLASDLEHPGRAIVLVVEDDSLDTGRERAMREAVAMLLMSLAPRDRVAVVTVPHGGLRADFTTDHAKVLRVFNAIIGQAPRAESDADAACRTRDTLQALTGLLDDLAGGEGPTTVVFFSTGLVGPSEMVLPPPGVAGQVQPLVGRCILLPETFAQTGTASQVARANIYIVRPDVAAPVRGRLEGIENLAGVTGGVRLSMGAAAEVALSQVARESAGYYLASFVPEARERDGLVHRVELRAASPGPVIRARAGVLIPKAPAPMVGAVATPARDLLRLGRQFRELPLRVAAYVSRESGDWLRIAALAEPVERGAEITSAAIGVIDAKGQIVSQWSAAAADLQARPLVAGLIASRGLYRVRAVLTDAAGRRGSADYELDAALTPAGPLRLSSLVAGLSRDGRFVPRLEFGSEASAMVQLEIYGGSAGSAIGALLEVSDAPAGKTLVAAPLVLEATGQSDRVIARGSIPIGALPPGDFVVRATIEPQGHPAGRVLRTIRKGR